MKHTILLITLSLISTLSLAANRKPVAVISVTPQTGYLPLAVQVNGAGSYDPDGTIVSYEWDFGDGSEATGVSASHTYTSGKKETLKLTVTDNNGKKENAHFVVNFTKDEQGPTLTFDAPDNFVYGVSTPTVTMFHTDATSQINHAKTKITLDGIIVTNRAVLSAATSTLQFTTAWPLVPGNHQLKVEIQDFYDNKTTRILNFNFSSPIVTTHYFNGRVLDVAGAPVAGAQVLSVVGPVGSQLSGLTNSGGYFSIPFTIGGDYQVQIAKAGFVSTYKYKTLLTGVDDVLPDVIVAIADTKQTTISASSGGTATNTSGSIQIVVPPGSLDMTRALSFTEAVTGKTLQVPLPGGSQFTYAQNNQPSGTQFSSPATMTIDNILGFPVGTEIPVGVTNEALGVWEDSNFKGVVSPDGTKINFNVTHFSDYDVNLNTVPPVGENQEPPNPKKTDESGNPPNKNCPCEKGSRIGATTNDLSIDYPLPALMRRGRNVAPTFTYSSMSVFPQAIISARTRGLQDVNDPIEVITNTYFAGFKKTRKYETSTVTQPSVYAEKFELKSPEGYFWGTGTFDYYVEIMSGYMRYYARTEYFGGAAGAMFETRIITREPAYLTEGTSDRVAHLNNTYGTNFGAGWTLNGQERLRRNSWNNIVTLDDGTGYATYYVPATVPAQKRLVQKRVGEEAQNISYHKGFFYGTNCQANEVYRIDQEGRYTTLLSNSTHKDLGLSCPTSVFPSRKGGYYVADSGNNRILYLTNERTIRVVAGTHKTPVNHPTFVTEDNVLAVHFVDGNEIKTISPHDGSILPLISEDDAPFKLALKKPTQIHFDENYNLLVLDQERGQLIKFYMSAGTSRVMLDGLKGITEMTYDPVLKRYYLLNEKGEIRHWEGTGTELTTLMDISSGNLKRFTGTSKDKANFPQVTSIAYSPEVGFVYATEQGLRLNKIAKDGMNTEDVYYLPPNDDFSTLVLHADGSYTRTLVDKTVISYNADGNIIQRLFVDSSSFVYEYGENQRLTKVTVPGGGDYDFTYYGFGLLQKVTDPSGRITEFTYDNNSNVVQLKNPEAELQKFTYDSDHLMTSHSDERDLVTLYAYRLGRVSQITYPGNRIKLVRNGVIDNALTVPLPGQPYPRVSPDASQTTFESPGDRTRSYKLDTYGLFTGIVDGNGDRNYVERDLKGQPIQTTSAEGRKDYKTYDLLGRVTTSLDALGNRYYEYDPTTQKISQVRDEKYQSTFFYYNSQGLLNNTSDGRGLNTGYFYNPDQTLNTITDANGRTITYTRDPLGNVIAVKNQADYVTTMTRDDAGNMLTSSDPLGHTTSYEYDAMNRPTLITDPKGGQTTMQYLPNGKLEILTDALGQSTTFVYNEQDEVSKIINPLNQEVNFTHDPDGNILSKITKSNQAISYTYDGNSQPLTKTMPGDGVVYTYDRDGLLVEMSDNDSVVQRSYDQFGRLEAEASNHVNGEVRWSYDAVGDNSRTQVSLDGREAITLEKSYDRNHRLVAVKGFFFGKQIGFSKTLDNLNRPFQLTHPNGQVTTMQYTRISQMAVQSTTSPAFYMDYRWSANGNLTEMPITRGAVTRTNHFIYDENSRLVAEQSIKNINYSYDAVGNNLANGAEFNELNQLTEDSGATYLYDANGNLIRKSSKSDASYMTFVYNPENQLISGHTYKSASTPVWSVVFKYDPSGRRIERAVTNHLNATLSYTQKFLYDGDHIIAMLDGTNQFVAGFLFDEGIDQPTGMVTDTDNDGDLEVITFVLDRQNSVRMITNNRAEVLQDIEYSAYGESQVIKRGQRNANIRNPFHYTGRELEPELGIYYYRARYYDPSTGRFMSEDPIGFAGGDYNLYRYVGNNPTKNVDPQGKAVAIPGLVAIGIISIGIVLAPIIWDYIFPPPPPAKYEGPGQDVPRLCSL